MGPAAEGEGMKGIEFLAAERGGRGILDHPVALLPLEHDLAGCGPGMVVELQFLVEKQGGIAADVGP